MYLGLNGSSFLMELPHSWIASVSPVVLVTSSGKKTPLVRAMQNAAHRMVPPFSVMAGDSDGRALTQYVADNFWRMPSTHEQNFDVLLAGCKERGVRAVFPTRDSELVFWARNRERFQAEGIEVVISSVESIELCIDKLAFAEFCACSGIPCIPTALGPDELGPGPYVIKERYGAGARNLGLGLNREDALRHAATLAAPIFQRQVHGQEISIDAWLDTRHQVRGMVLRTRDLVINGESQVTTTFRDEAIENMVADALMKLSLRGPVVMQAFMGAKREIQLIECNARFGGASTASIAAGLDSLYWSLLEAVGDNSRNYPFCRINGEVRQIRVAADICEYGSSF